jgi:alkylated DNA repair dioxygenase AlkB
LVARNTALPSLISPDQPVALEDGSLVVMPAGSQEFYVHRLKKATKQQVTGARINLTFRMMSGN